MHDTLVMQGSISSEVKPILRMLSLSKFSQCKLASRKPFNALYKSRKAGDPSRSDTLWGSFRIMYKFGGSGECMKACETSNDFSRSPRWADNDSTKWSPSMLGVGLLIPSARAEIPSAMSLATIRTRTRDSLLYAATQRLGMILSPACFFCKFSTSLWLITLPALHFSKFSNSSRIPSKPKSAFNCISEESSITSSGFQSSTSVPPSRTLAHVWSRSAANLTEFNSRS